MSKIGKDLKGWTLQIIIILQVIKPLSYIDTETNKAANGDRKGKKISETEFRMICTFHTSLTTR